MAAAAAYCLVLGLGGPAFSGRAPGARTGAIARSPLARPRARPGRPGGVGGDQRGARHSLRLRIVRVRRRASASGRFGFVRGDPVGHRAARAHRGADLLRHPGPEPRPGRDRGSRAPGARRRARRGVRREVPRRVRLRDRMQHAPARGRRDRDSDEHARPDGARRARDRSRGGPPRRPAVHDSRDHGHRRLWRPPRCSEPSRRSTRNGSQAGAAANRSGSRARSGSPWSPPSSISACSSCFAHS